MASKKRKRSSGGGAVNDDVIARARAGDGDAFNLIVETYRNRLFGLAVGILRRRDAAEDVVQEAFIKAYKNLAKFRGDANIYTWLYRITVNTAHNYLRSARRKSAVDFEEVAPVIEAKGADPATATVTAELGVAIEGAVAALPPRQREVFILHYFEQLHHREIADILEITEGAVKAHFFHAVRKLRGTLADYVS